MSWSIKILNDESGEKLLGLSEGRWLVAGRSSKCDICLKHPKISRRQLALKMEGGGVLLHLLPEASTRTRLNGVTVEKDSKHPLAEGALIDVAAVRIVLISGTKDDTGVSKHEASKYGTKSSPDSEMDTGNSEMSLTPDVVSKLDARFQEEEVDDETQFTDAEHTFTEGDETRGTLAEEGGAPGEGSDETDYTEAFHKDMEREAPEFTDLTEAEAEQEDFLDEEDPELDFELPDAPIEDDYEDVEEMDWPEEDMPSVDRETAAPLGAADAIEYSSGEDETQATAALPDFESNTSHAEKSETRGEDETGYLSEDELKEYIDKYSSKSRRKFTRVLLIIAAFFFALIWMANQFSGERLPRVHQGTYFEIQYPPSWESGTRGSVLAFSPRGGGENGVYIWRTRANLILGYDYNTAFETAHAQFREELPDLADVLWEDWVGTRDFPTLHAPDGVGIPYASRQGRGRERGHALMRIYLSRDHLVALLAWENSRSLSNAHHIVMDSFELNPSEFPPDYLRRDIVWTQAKASASLEQRAATESEAVSDQEDARTNAGRLYRDRAANLSNAWRAADTMMNWVRHQQTDSSTPDFEDLEWWSEMETYAAYVQQEYRRRRASLIAARNSGDSNRVRAMAGEIQQLIPDPLDPRWIWAQKALAEAGSGRGGRGGLF